MCMLCKASPVLWYVCCVRPHLFYDMYAVSGHTCSMMCMLSKAHFYLFRMLCPLSPVICMLHRPYLFYDVHAVSGLTCSVCCAGSSSHTSLSRCCTGLASMFLVSGVRISSTERPQCLSWPAAQTHSMWPVLSRFSTASKVRISSLCLMIWNWHKAQAYIQQPNSETLNRCLFSGTNSI